MMLVGILKVLLYKYTEQENIIIGSPIAGREHMDLEDQIGFYVNTLALRDYICGADSFSDVLKKVKTTILEAYEHQSYPFDKIVEDLGMLKGLEMNPLFEIMLVLQNADIREDEMKINDGRLKIINYGYNNITSRFDINFNIQEEQAGLNVVIEYNSDLYERAFILLLRDRFLQLIGMCPGNMSANIGGIAFKDPVPENGMANEWEICFNAEV